MGDSSVPELVPVMLDIDPPSNFTFTDLTCSCAAAAWTVGRGGCGKAEKSSALRYALLKSVSANRMEQASKL